MNKTWGALDHRLGSGQLLLPGSAVFDRARRGFNRRFDEVVPQAIVRCRTAGDVSVAIGFAAAHDLKLAVRSGGHCFAGNSATEGLLIDTSPMRAIVMHNDVAIIGAGARLGEAYAALEEHGRTVPGGTCPSVGLSGLALGGGLGILGRRYGVTSDRMVAARVVLADGELVDCDEQRHPDLFWALRGAGTGSFGIVVSLSLRTVPVPVQTWNRHLTWPAAEAEAVAGAWQHWAPWLPGEIAASLKVTVAGAHAPVSVDLYVTDTGSGAGPGVIDDLVARVGTRPTGVGGRDGSFGVARHFWAELGAPEPGPAEPDAAGTAAEPERAFLLAKSEFFDRPLPGLAMAELLAAFGEDLEPGVSRELDFMPWGGAYNETSAGATAFVHRLDQFQLKQSTVVAPAAGVGAASRARRWLSRSWDIAHREGTGRVFPNFADPDLESPAESYYGGNLARLRLIKQRYDPGNTFRHAQSVPLAPLDPRR